MAHISRNVLECNARQPFCGLENGWGPSQMFVAYTEHTLTVKSNFHFHFPRGGQYCVLEKSPSESSYSWAVFLVLSKGRLIYYQLAKQWRILKLKSILLISFFFNGVLNNQNFQDRKIVGPAERFFYNVTLHVALSF